MRLHRIFLTFFAVMLFTGSLFGADAKTIIANMRSRLPVVTKMLKEGSIGENNQGYLEVLDKNLVEAYQKVVALENADRKEVYTAIAKQQNVTVEQVGKRRAAKIAQKAAKGTMLQDEKGNWNRK